MEHVAVFYEFKVMNIYPLRFLVFVDESAETLYELHIGFVHKVRGGLGQYTKSRYKYDQSKHDGYQTIEPCQPVKYSSINPTTSPIDEYVSDCRCLPPETSATELCCLPIFLLYQPMI